MKYDRKILQDARAVPPEPPRARRPTPRPPPMQAEKLEFPFFADLPLEVLDERLYKLFDKLDALAALSKEPSEAVFATCDELAALICITNRRNGRERYVEIVNAIPVNSLLYSAEPWEDDDDA